MVGRQTSSLDGAGARRRIENAAKGKQTAVTTELAAEPGRPPEDSIQDLSDAVWLNLVPRRHARAWPLCNFSPGPNQPQSVIETGPCF